MSRTFRRKNWEDTQRDSWANKGRRQFGFYVENKSVGNATASLVFPTKQEIHKQYWDIHSDNHQNAWTPSRWYRKERNKQNRMLTKQELAKYKKSDYYEVMAEANPRSHLWDWY